MSKILDYDRRFSDQSDTKCAQIITKSTTITKDILEDLGPKSASLCGRDYNTRHLWVLCGLSVLFLTSCSCIGLMFGTTQLDDYVLSQITLKNDTLSYQMWKGPAVKTYLNVYVFNYTNVEAYENGDAEKLQVDEIGPYVYEETMEKVNVKFHANGTVSYQEKRVHRYRDDLSGGRSPNDSVIVPNLPMLGAAATGKDYLYPFRLMLSGVFHQLDAKPFINVPIDKFIWGYDDVFYSVVKDVLSFYRKLPLEKFGILGTRKGTSEDVFSVHSGVNNINKVKQIDTFNGNNYLPYWGSEQCNEVKGSDGSAFAPMDVRRRGPISVFNKEMARTIKLIYDQDVKIFNGKVTAARYIMPKSTFDSAERNVDNECYCIDECSPQGVFNTAAAAFGAPIFMSLPHFYNAEDEIKTGVDGMKPHQVADNYVLVHPTLGFAMGGRSSLQLNVQVQKSLGMSQLEMFENDIILPMAWVQMALEESDLPDAITNSIYLVSLTVPTIELCLKYGSILGAIVTFVSIVIIVTGTWSPRKRR
uniref:Scavenger receptor class B member 1 n=2 Tax=Photinus pyralis TaxID=7054 RepID=A0A1Y1KK00_PHOPY